MTELTDRLGMLHVIQISIEAWNGIFLLIMVFSMIYDRKHGKAFIPASVDIIIFYLSIFLYNLLDIFCLVTDGDTSGAGFFIRRAAEFGYCFVGMFHPVFVLYMFKKHVAAPNGLTSLSKAITFFQLLQLPGLVMLILTPSTGALYYFDAKNIYHRGPLYVIWALMTLIAIAFLFVAILLYRKKTDKFVFRVVLISSTLPLAFMVINYFFSELSFNNIAVSVTALIVFLMYERNKAEDSVRNVRALAQAQRQLAESRLALEESKNQTLMAQIQPHFINNSLMAIRSRCYDYPEVYESLTNFSRYLRANFEALGDTRLILFEQEMENIEAYLSLERQNFGERLQVEYDIECDDFLLPALSVQPLVENAVRHGVATYKDGGTVQINAHRSGGVIVIEVIDRGSGKRNITEQQSKRKGIGVENVRKRLQSMSNGSLEIIPDEHGTTARITMDEIGGKS